MGLFGKRDDEKNVNTSTTPVDQHIIDEVNNMPKAEGAGGGSVERMTKNSDELQRLLDEFKAMQDENGQIDTTEVSETEGIDESEREENHAVEEGEKYTLSAEENDQIEKYLLGDDDEEEEYMPIEEIEEEVEEVVEEEALVDDDDVIYIDESAPIESYDEEELVDEEEVVEDEEPIEEVIEDDAEVIEDEEDEIIENEAYEDEVIEDEDEAEIIEDEDDEIIEDDPYEDEIIEDTEDEIIEDEAYEDETEIIEDEPYAEDEVIEDTVEPSIPSESMTESDIDKKLEEKLSAFEEQLLAKLMATMNMSNQQQPTSTAVVAPLAIDADAVEELEDLKFEGQVVIFEPIEKIKQATWEDVVRRKGHYTYHVTGANNGGWFIKRAKSANPYAYVERKEEAMKLAIAYAKREKAELKVHDAKGVIEASMSFGREKKMN